MSAPTTSTVDRRHRLVTWLGLVGAALGVLAGMLQATIGTRIPEWTGAKAAPLALGLLTIGLSALAGWVAVWQGRAGLSVWARAGCALGMIGPGLLCLSTVGRLWYPPAVLLIGAGLLTIDSWRATARAVAADWLRVLLGALGGFELLMAAGAAAVPMVIGAVGGLALMAAALTTSRGARAGLIVLGTVPFAAVAWAALVPVLLAVLTLVVAIPLLRRTDGKKRTVTS